MRCDGGPRYWTILANANNADLYLIALARDRAFGDTARFAICVQPAAEKFFEIFARVVKLRVRVTVLFEGWLCHVLRNFLEMGVTQREVLAQEIISASAVVFEEMKLGQHQQPFHDH